MSPRIILKHCPNGQCRAEVLENKVSLISYFTTVIIIDYDNGTIECTGTYSATTRRHIAHFLREYKPELTYKDMKEIAGKGPVPLVDLLGGGE